MPPYASFRRELGHGHLLPCLLVGVSSFLLSPSTNYNSLLILLLAFIVGFSYCQGTCHSFDVPKQSFVQSMINVFFILTIS